MCDICCTPYTSKLRKKITCKYCNYEACTACIKTYLLNILTDPKCMKCNVAWDPEFIEMILSHNFLIKDFKKHRENVLLEREKNLLPDTIHLVELEIQKRKLHSKMSELLQERSHLLNALHELDMGIQDIRTEIANLNLNKIKEEKRTFLKGCPKEGCRGFLNNNWICGICDTEVCNQCHLEKSEDHVCKDEDIESAKLLSKDSKPCPSCSAMIFKSEGCNQMWCTQCHNAFDWKTGKIENTVIHNPHYYDWLRQQNNGEIPRNPGDVQNCGGLPTHWAIQDHLRRNNIKFDHYNYERSIRHFQAVEIPRVIYDNDNSDLRVKYLLNEIDDEEMKKDLQKREVKKLKLTAYLNVFQMFCNVGTDLMNKILTLKTNKDAEQLHSEFNKLRSYYNECMKDLSKRYGSRLYKGLNKLWYVTNNLED